jgi:hypothetical protein
MSLFYHNMHPYSVATYIYNILFKFVGMPSGVVMSCDIIPVMLSVSLQS